MRLMEYLKRLTRRDRARFRPEFEEAMKHPAPILDSGVEYVHMQPGDVVAIKTHQPLSDEQRVRWEEYLRPLRAGGVEFVMFEDVDLTVFRPYPYEHLQGRAMTGWPGEPLPELEIDDRGSKRQREESGGQA